MSKLETKSKVKNLNLYQLGLKSGVSRNTIYGLIDNTRKWKNIQLESAINLCLTLNCKLSDLVENDKSLLESIKKYERIK